MLKRVFHSTSKTSFLTFASRLLTTTLNCANRLARSTIFFGLFIQLTATSALAADGETASLCPTGELIVVTHQGDATVIRCRADYTAPAIVRQAAPHAAPVAPAHRQTAPV